MVDKINFKISVPGKSESHSFNPMTFETAKKLIYGKKYPKDIEDALIKILSKRPNNSYEKFFKDIYIHLNRIQNSKK